QKFAKCARSRPGSSEANGRYVPAEIRRTVSQRDGGQCTFMSENGRRCEANTWLEFDHIQPVARNGERTTENLRLRCRAHNQYEARRVFGAGFMEHKRHEARSKTTRAREQAAEKTAAIDTTAPASTTDRLIRNHRKS
ncbi:MAG: HNH endonuclease, partial [Candidatus Eisenbacteria bacterium]